MKPSPAPAEESKDMVFNGQYQAKKKISAGSFGTVYTGVDLKSNENVAIKIEKVTGGDEMRSVIREGTFLKKLENIRGIPKVYWSGSKGDQDVLVLTLLGKDLASYLKIYKKFSLKTVLMIADQLLVLLENIHNRCLLHRDIKPENILVGKGEQGDTIFFVDFGISKYYKDNLGRHIAYREKKSFIGTTRYASIAAHLGNEISRKDDLESLAYVIIFLAKGQLPWQNLNVSEAEKTKKVGEIKIKTTVEELCKGLPEEIGKYLSYVKNLSFKENPDYIFLKGLIMKAAMINNIIMDNQWDWALPLKIEHSPTGKKKGNPKENQKHGGDSPIKDPKKKEEKMNIIIKKETMGKKKLSQENVNINSSLNNINSPFASPKASYKHLNLNSNVYDNVNSQLRIPDLASQKGSNTSYASSYRGSSVAIKYDNTSKMYPDEFDGKLIGFCFLILFSLFTRHTINSRG